MINLKEQIINNDPVIKVVKPIFKDNLCKDIINESEKYFSDSEVKDKNYKKYRKSSSFDISSKICEEDVFKLFNNRYIKAFAKNFLYDDIQITRYKEGEYYLPHFDAYNLLKKDKNIYYQRVKTIILYLNDDYVGGEINFPNLNLKIKPLKGHFLLFDNCIFNSHYLHPYSLHESKKLIKGNKYIATLWLKEAIQDF